MAMTGGDRRDARQTRNGARKRGVAHCRKPPGRSHVHFARSLTIRARPDDARQSVRMVEPLPVTSVTTMLPMLRAPLRWRGNPWPSNITYGLAGEPKSVNGSRADPEGLEITIYAGKAS